MYKTLKRVRIDKPFIACDTLHKSSGGDQCCRLVNIFFPKKNIKIPLNQKILERILRKVWRSASAASAPPTVLVYLYDSMILHYIKIEMIKDMM